MRALAIALLAAATALAQDAPEIRVEKHVMAYPADAAAAAALTIGFVGQGMPPGGRVVKGAPYAAEAVSETVQTLADGNRITHRNTTQLYRDAEGRTRRQERLGAVGPWGSAGEAPEMIMIDDPVANAHYVLDPANKTANKAAVRATRTPGPGHRELVKLTEVHQHLRRRVAPGEGPAEEFNIQIGAVGRAEGQASKTETLGKRTIEGVQAEGTKATTVIPAGAIGNERPIEIVSERWYSPELQMVVLSRTSDPRMGETTYRIVGLQRGEQPKSLFEVPSDYTVKEGGDVLFMRKVVKEPAKQE